MTEKNINIDTDIILKYLDKNASPDEIQHLREWISLSKENAEHFQEIRNIWEVAGSELVHEDINTHKALEKVRSRIATSTITKAETDKIKMNPAKKKVRAITYFQRIAAILILPVLIALTVYVWKGNQQKSLVTYNEVTAPYGMVSTLTLPDGSKVWLNAGSSLKYPTVFAEKTREVEMNGEAYFEVHADKKHPFTVNTGILKITATGTAFNVSSFARSKEETITLVSGKVSVAHNKTVMQLSPGQQLNYEKGTSEMRITDIDPFQYVSWKDGILTFRDDPLESVLKKLEQIYHVRFVVQDTSINQYTYRATFKEETLNDILNYLEISIPITFQKVESENEKNDSTSVTTIAVYKNQQIMQ